MRQSPFTAVYDACVLYPAPLRDFLMWLGLSGRFRARWSPQIHEEWKRNLLAKRPDLTREQIDRTSALMDQAIPDGLVTDHEDLVAGLTLPDPGDGMRSGASRRCVDAWWFLRVVDGEPVRSSIGGFQRPMRCQCFAACRSGRGAEVRKSDRQPAHVGRDVAFAVANQVLEEPEC